MTTANTYTFEDITAAQALAYSNTDNLVVSTSASTGNHFRVQWVTDPGTITTPASTHLVVSDTTSGVTKTFGTGLEGETITMASTGSTLYVGHQGSADTGFGTMGAVGGAFLGGGDDTITGSATADFIQGNAGNDTLLDGGGAGNDTIFGGQGNDIITLSATGHDFVNGNLGDDTINASAATGGSTLLGGQGNDSIMGTSGADNISGDLGNDVIDGHGGNDLLHGGAGNDSITLTFSATTDDSQAFGDDGNDTITTTAGASHTATIEINGNVGNDVITAIDIGSSVYHGGAGNDTISSTGAGSKSIFGDLGDDSITASGAGSHTIDGGAGNDTFAITTTGNDSILGGDGNDVMTITAGGNDTISGGDGHDSVTLTAVSFSHSIDLGAGNDTLSDIHSGVGNDTILGGAGDDVIGVTTTGAASTNIDGGDGNDSITTIGATGNDTILGGAGNDTIDASAHSGGHGSLVGGAGDDLIKAGGGGDTLSGGDGNDTLVAGAGQDVLSGGTGADKFDFSIHTSNFTQGSLDSITDWESTDKLHFDSTTVTGTNYIENTLSTYALATAYANAQFSGANHVVAVQVGTDVVVFADTHTGSGLETTDSAVILVGRSLSDIDSSNIVGS